MDFVEACMKGEAKPEDIDDWVEDWHKSQSKLPLHEWLGLTLTGVYGVCNSTSRDGKYCPKSY